MNLTDLANHICEQCGMNDADDVSAAKMFLQRRLEMIWNTQLWRASLIEATMTINPDGTCTLSNTVWIPSRATLLLPPEFESVIAVRADNHSMNVASLESYYRTDTDWLDMQGDPTEFQVLRPAVWEFATATALQAANGTVNLAYSPDGVTRATSSVAAGALSGAIQLLLSATSATTTARIDPVGNVASSLTVQGAGTAGANGVYTFTTSNDFGLGIIIWTNAATGYIIQSLDHGLTWFITAPNSDAEYQATNPTQTTTPPLTGWSQSLSFGAPPVPTLFYGAASQVAALTFNGNSLPARQRIRLTTIPQLSTNLRVLGKTACPVLGDYDSMPINNVESCLMAFARGDMLLRARQNGKAQIAAQEGATLLAQLARSEAFQTANNFRIVPDNGFGGDNVISQPNSLHPL